MDALTGLLDGPRARDAFLLRSIMNPPWCLRIQDGAALTVVAVTRGAAWVIPETGEPVRLGQGDAAVIRGPEPYAVADDPSTPPQAIILPGQQCMTPTGEHLELWHRGVRTWGPDPDGSTVVLTGTYESAGEVSRRLLNALPTVLVPPAGDWSPLVGLLDTEIAKDDPGQPAVLDRLLDLLLIATLRAWLARPDADAPGWYRAHGDPVVGEALRIVQNNPAHPWTVASLAGSLGVSRASLARRFTALVGEPPMTFLTRIRLDLAADILRESDATIDTVAREVGYGSAFALSAAFKRERGVSPHHHRLAAAGV